MTIVRAPGTNSQTPKVGPALHGYTQPGVNRLNWIITAIYGALMVIVWGACFAGDCATNHNAIWWFVGLFSPIQNSTWNQEVKPWSANIGMVLIIVAIGIQIFRASGEIEYQHEMAEKVRAAFTHTHKDIFRAIWHMISEMLSNVGLVFIVLTSATTFFGLWPWLIESGLFLGITNWGVWLLHAGFGVFVCGVISFCVMVMSHFFPPMIAMVIKSAVVGYEDAAVEKDVRHYHHDFIRDLAKTGKLWDQNGNQIP